MAKPTVANIKRDGPDGASIDYPASVSGRLRTDGTSALNIANVWSVSCWFFLRGSAAQSIFDALPTSGFDNQITFVYQTPATPGGPERLEISLRDEDGTLFKDHSFTARESRMGGLERFRNVWLHTVFTWDGTDLILYVNGAVHPAFLKATDLAGTMVQDGAIFRRAAIGRNNAGGGGLDGKIHSVALLDIAMTQAQVDKAHNGGFKDFDLLTEFGSNLKHWWRLGQPTGTTGVGGDLAVDYVTTGGVSIEAENIQTAKFVTLSQDGNIWSVKDTAQGKATLFTQDGEELYGSSVFGRTDFGMADAWSVTFWYRKDLAGTGHIFVLTASFGSTVNRIHFIDSVGRIDIALYDETGDVFRQYNTGQVFPLGIWSHIGVTFDGVPDPAVLKIYADGVEQTDFNLLKRLDVDGEMTDRSRRLLIGADPGRLQNLEGRVTDIVLHKNALTAAEVAQIYSRRGSFHPSIDVNDYVSAANLLHFYKPGELASDIGKDYISGLGVPEISIGSDATEIDPVTDIVGDHP